MTRTTLAPPPPAPEADRDRPQPGTLRRWATDLAMGARFAVGGGREGWVRTVLTAFGVGIGVTVLLVAASVPNMIGAREARTEARENYGFTPGGATIQKSDRSALQLTTDTTYHGERVRGRILQPEGDRPPVPPGIDGLPGPGEMLASPALRDLLNSPDGALLRERLPYDVVGTVAKEGLAGPGELTYYAGSDELAGVDNAHRIDRFDVVGPPEPLHPVLLLLIVVICVVLLLPVGAFMAAAVRFGTERRDRRLAALRLVGTDGRATRRIAAGEAGAAALLGLAVGTAGFLALRPALSGLRMQELSVFTSDVVPDPLITVLIALAVPGCAVLVTLLALRGVVIEPLGVVRRSEPRRRHLWWRLIPPVLGVGLLVPLFGDFAEEGGQLETAMVAGGIVLILVGVTALLPWLVEFAVRRLHGGRLPFQLAVRRLQLDSGTAARAVSGITVAVAGSIALAGLLGSVAEQETRETGQDPTRAQMAVHADPSAVGGADAFAARLADALGVRDAWGVTHGYVFEAGEDPDDSPWVGVTVADCATLRRLAPLPSCKSGDVFLAPATGQQSSYSPDVEPGTRLDLGDPDQEDGRKRTERDPGIWTVPEDARTVRTVEDPSGRLTEGVLATPGSLDAGRFPSATAALFVRLDPGEPEAREYVRNAVAAVGPDPYVMDLTSEKTSRELQMIKRGLYVGAVGILVLIGASMIVSVLEQLRERKRLLSVLVAFGTRRSTLAWSVLWQTALPVLLGLALAALTGAGLGAVLLRVAGLPMGVDGAALGAMTGLGGALIVVVTLLSLPVLWRLMRPDGLRTE
ncbi:ABC transporter permease [Streptomyces sp. RKND-216]|uniref:FtsX-like permease family protein n=1 Tax=Streptomyces sp. RKND-216 TaxID=2562581 RepID=UPI00109E3381|nr:FtsX-like permease family protein [Streptomyces sp. RKND-216]THA24736.1 ABC transporter permease [Streptomyces sp. RKND-216]